MHCRKYAVSSLRVPSVLYYGLSIFVQALLLTLLAVHGLGARVRADWRLHRREALGVAILSPLSYIRVLPALTFSPVSYIAPAREVGALRGTAMGIRFLTEPAGRQRPGGAAAIALGVLARAAGRSCVTLLAGAAPRAGASGLCRARCAAGSQRRLPGAASCSWRAARGRKR